MYIKREFEANIFRTFDSPTKKGLILAGIVGCGKTTLVQHCLEQIRKAVTVFEYTGDDVQFRAKVAEDSKYLFNEVVSQTQGRSLIFVDEVQKSEAIFDALKYAFDHGNISFLVTGSNPEYLNTVARKRLQRRADLMTLLPFSLPEILSNHGHCPRNLSASFSSLLFESKKPELPAIKMVLTPEITTVIENYLSVGGLPLAFLSPPKESFIEIRKTVERGFEGMLLDANDIRELILVELAHVHSREFTYTHLFKKTGLRRRESVNKIIGQLKDHGYLFGKKPIFFAGHHRSYLAIYSYVDPGVLSYLLGDPKISKNVGARVEGVVHARLVSLMQQVPLKSELGYFKPYKTMGDGEIKFSPGEIDFVCSVGERKIPIEVKAAQDIQSIDTSLLKTVVKQYSLPFGIVLYGGVPYLDKGRKLVFWPWWGI